MRFYSEQRIRQQRSFSAIRQEGRRVFLRGFIMQTRERTQGTRRPQFAVIASRRVGNAVLRNRIKRLMRELFRQYQERFPAYSQTVFVIKPGQKSFDYNQLEGQIQIGLIRFFGQRKSHASRISA